MAERGDMTVLHEPFCNLKNYGETDAGDRTFHSAASLLAWLRGEAHDRDVFFKDTMDHQHDEVLADRPFLAEARHAFLIRQQQFRLRAARARVPAHRREFPRPGPVRRPPPAVL
jgi:hypothetical protein